MSSTARFSPWRPSTLTVYLVSLHNRPDTHGTRNQQGTFQRLLKLPISPQLSFPIHHIHGTVKAAMNSPSPSPHTVKRTINAAVMGRRDIVQVLKPILLLLSLFSFLFLFLGRLKEVWLPFGVLCPSLWSLVSGLLNEIMSTITILSSWTKSIYTPIFSSGNLKLVVLEVLF